MRAHRESSAGSGASTRKKSRVRAVDHNTLMFYGCGTWIESNDTELI